MLQSRVYDFLFLAMCKEKCVIIKKFIDNKKLIEYCKRISLIQSGGVIRDYEATATPEMNVMITCVERHRN